MAKRVVWSKPAVADRISILEYWAHTDRLPDLQQAPEFGYSQLLSQFPALGRRLQGREERFFVVDHYLVIYFDAPERIEILHVSDSRRNPENLPI